MSNATTADIASAKPPCAKITQMAVAFAVRGSETPDGDRCAGLLQKECVQFTLQSSRAQKREEIHHSGDPQQIVDVPVEGTNPSEMPPQATFESPERGACIRVEASFEQVLTQSTDSNFSRNRDLQEEAVDSLHT